MRSSDSKFTLVLYFATDFVNWRFKRIFCGYCMIYKYGYFYIMHVIVSMDILLYRDIHSILKGH